MLHFLLCCALTYAPYYILYSGSRLKEERALRPVIQAGLGYVATVSVVSALTVLITSVVSLPDLIEETRHFSIVAESVRALLCVVRIVGAYFTIQNIPNLGRFGNNYGIRILVVVLGWAGAEALLHYLAPLWLGARGKEFSWEYLELGVLSNLHILLHGAMIASVWLLSRKPIPMTSYLFPIITLAAYVLYAPAIHFLRDVLGLSALTVMLARAAACSGMAIFASTAVRAYRSHVLGGGVQVQRSHQQKVE